MQIERFENRRLSLRWKARSTLRHATKRVHLLGRQELARVGPPFGALLRSNPDLPVPVFHHRELVTVF
jgi:hypothetical protein